MPQSSWCALAKCCSRGLRREGIDGGRELTRAGECILIRRERHIRIVCDDRLVGRARSGGQRGQAGQQQSRHAGTQGSEQHKEGIRN